MSAFAIETIELDLPALAGAFGRRLHDAGVPVTSERSARFARALTLVRPVTRRRLYFTARSVFVSDLSQLHPFDRVFADVFGAGATDEHVVPDARETVPAPADDREAARAGGTSGAAGLTSPAAAPAERGHDSAELPVPTLASDEEVLRSKRFDAIEHEELVALYRLMAQLRIATPVRRARRARRAHHGERIDLRRTLRGSMPTGGDPIRLARRRRRVIPRRLVLLCDISGSMEPYARAYLQFLTCAAHSAPVQSRAEAFAFATRLTRLTRALHSRSPERAIQRAAATAPDWSSGTRIGEALKAFNDLHGRRGMARGAVIVILSDGWERGDPALVAREMARLRRLAHRIVWVNPRVSGAEFAPRTGGMAAALPHVDALVSGHSLEALAEVVDAIGAAASDLQGLDWRAATAPAENIEEPWASATPVAGSSVAMPSGYSPSRGKTTPGWGGLQ